MSKTQMCPHCGTNFSTNRTRTYCTKACSNAATAEKRAAANRALGKYKPPICPCGKEVPPPPGQKHVYGRQKKHCSPECRSQYQKRRQADPANHVTFNCRNCDIEVTRPRTYGQGYHKYCSNACAARHTKRVSHTIIRDHDVVLDSGWEALFFGLCMFRKIPVERYDRSLGVTWRDDQYYAPDFLVNGTMAVEIKGVEDEDDPEKWESFRSSVGPLVVLDRDELEKLLSDQDCSLFKV